MCVCLCNVVRRGERRQVKEISRRGFIAMILFLGILMSRRILYRLLIARMGILVEREGLV